MKKYLSFPIAILLFSCNLQVKETEIKTVPTATVQNIDTVPMDSKEMKISDERYLKEKKFESDIR